MIFLVDSNVWLEKLLGQGKTAEVDDFLAAVPAEELAITDFSLYSIGLRLTRAELPRIYDAFLNDVVAPGDTHVVRLSPSSVGASGLRQCSGTAGF